VPVLALASGCAIGAGYSGDRIAIPTDRAAVDADAAGTLVLTPRPE